MPSRLSDELLARRAAAGHLDCFEELLARYRDRVYRQLHRYDPGQPLAPWLFRVVGNTCVNLAKTRARRQERLPLELEEPDTGEAEGAVALAPDPLEAVLSGEEARVVLAAVDALAPDLREAVVLRVVEELSFRELAEALGVPLQTAATRVRRALAQVRQRLARSGARVDR
jgi:RNA polymerase sigma-70 factor (ECF subfamily)